MKTLSDLLIDIFQTYHPTTNTWLQYITGIGHKIESSNGSIGYYTSRNGFQLTTNNSATPPYYDVVRGQHTFAIADTNGTAAYIYLSGNATYNIPHDEVAAVSYPLTATLVGDADNIEEYASALAFILSTNHHIESVSLNLNKPENLQSAAKSSRRTRNTATGVANISFTVIVHQGKECTIIGNC
jgi:hypothetical protein